MFIRKIALLAIGAVWACCSGLSQAAVVTYSWTGNVTSGAAVGGSNTISGTFSYDNAATGSGNIATPTAISYTFGNLSGSLTGNIVAVFDNLGSIGDQFDLRGGLYSYTGSLVNDSAPSQFFLRFNDLTQTAFNSTSLPAMLDPSKFTFPNQFESRIDGWNVAFVTTSLRAGADATTVPEPGSLALLGLAAAAVGFSRRKDRAAA